MLQIDMSHSPRITGYSAKQRETVPIYCMNKPAFRFILILEGRATVKLRNVGHFVKIYKCFVTWKLLISLDSEFSIY